MATVTTGLENCPESSPKVLRDAARLAGQAPMFQALFALHNFPTTMRQLPGLVLEPLIHDVQLDPFRERISCS
jgi:hypothetical protein